MLILKPHSIARSVVGAGCPSQQLLSLRVQVCHPHTRTYVRLLGPCFKTGRMKPFSQRAGGMWADDHPQSRTGKPVLPWERSGDLTTGPRLSSGKGLDEGFRTPAGKLPIPPQFSPSPNWRWHARQDPPRTSRSEIPMVRNNLAKRNWFHSLVPSAISGTFNSLFKVLFTFPSRYLFAIGLLSIFSFGWSIPPD